MEKTLGQVAWEAESVELGDGGWEYTTVNDQRKAQAVADAVVAANEARRWKPIESAPKDQYILAWSPERRMAFQVLWCGSLDDWQLLGMDGIATMEFTLWTPIPAPPKEASDGR